MRDEWCAKSEFSVHSHLTLYTPVSWSLRRGVWAEVIWAVLHGSVVWVWDLTVSEFVTQTVDDTRNVLLDWWGRDRERLLTMTFHHLKQACAQSNKPQYFTVQNSLSTLQSGEMTTMYTYWISQHFPIRLDKEKRKSNNLVENMFHVLRYSVVYIHVRFTWLWKNLYAILN